MRTPAQIAGHPIHPMLVALPIGMWVFSLAADLISLRSASPDTWQAAALYTMVGGIVGALAAAVPGLVDLLSLKDDAVVRPTAIKHMSLNLAIVALYAINAWERVQGSVSPTTSLLLSAIGIAALLVSGWLGGKMVYEAGVAVHAEDAAAGSAGSWNTSRDRRARADGGAGRGWAGEGRAMAADSEKPSREAGEDRRG